jgi:hypothetical protein
MRRLTVGLLFLASACASAGDAAARQRPGEPLWAALEPLCGKAFEGRVVEGTEPSDAAFADQRLVMWVRDCGEGEIRIPFHVGSDRSRTWILSRSPGGVRLKHDHRHVDGVEDEISRYGGDTEGPATGLSLDFHADAYTAELLPAAATNIWTMAVDPGRTFAYALRREAEGRRFRVEFDLTRPVEVLGP